MAAPSREKRKWATTTHQGGDIVAAADQAATSQMCSSPNISSGAAGAIGKPRARWRELDAAQELSGTHYFFLEGSLPPSQRGGAPRLKQKNSPLQNFYEPQNFFGSPELHFL